MEHCSKCGNVMHGFNYGFGFNPICSECHYTEQRQKHNDDVQKLQKEKLELEIKILKSKSQ